MKTGTRTRRQLPPEVEFVADSVCIECNQAPMGEPRHHPYCPECWARMNVRLFIWKAENEYKLISEPRPDMTEDTDNFQAALEILGIELKILKQLKMRF
jgi:hypothetical protein